MEILVNFIGMPIAWTEPSSPNGAAIANRDALWEIVHDRCQPGYRRTGAYAPCALVDEESDIALYKVDFDPYQFLLLPLTRITGIEDPILQNPLSHSYLYDAWVARTLITARLNNLLPESGIVLTINPKNARSQDQLHIHISCASPATRASLKDFDVSEYAFWKPFLIGSDDTVYQALTVSRKKFESKNLFREIYTKVTADGRRMEHATVALVNIAPDQFLLLVGEGTEQQSIAAEHLQDHDCSIVENR